MGTEVRNRPCSPVSPFAANGVREAGPICPDLRIHDLRNGAAVMAAQSGGTLADLMQRLGHSTSRAAMRYQHAAQGRDADIAVALSRVAQGGHVPREEWAAPSAQIRTH